MTERIRRLRNQSLKIKPYITPERARLITEFYRSRSADSVSRPVQRALAFRYLLEKKAVCLNPGELIVGERGPAPKATPTYPEITAHSLRDLRILHSRKKTSFSVDEATRELYKKEIIPFWRGKSIRDRIFAEMSPEWIEAYKAGIFTEFMEQRAPGHTVLDGKIYRKGFLDFIQDIRRSMDELDFLHDPEAYKKREELKAMAICAEALIMYAGRHAAKAARLAQKEKDPQRRKELEKIAEVCSWVPAHAPRDFWEA
ncbi:MAG: pyruvate formate lyase family protein, partial [Candidatus Aminicenantales bacterium]